MIGRIKGFLGTKLGQHVERIAAVFAATFTVTLVVNGDHLFRAHGLSAVTSALPSLAVAALYAAYRVVRPQVNATVTAEVGSVPALAAVESIAAAAAKRTARKTPAKK